MALINIFGSVFVVRREKRVLKVLFFFFVLLCTWNRVSTTRMLQDGAYEERVIRSKRHFSSIERGKKMC